MTKRIGQILPVCLMLFIISCATDVEMLKGKSYALRNVGEAYMNSQNYTAALREFLKAEKIYSEDHILQHDLGFTYMAKGQIDLAIKHFQACVDLKVTSYREHTAAGLELAHLKKGKDK